MSHSSDSSRDFDQEDCLLNEEKIPRKTSGYRRKRLYPLHVCEILCPVLVGILLTAIVVLLSTNLVHQRYFVDIHEESPRTSEQTILDLSRDYVWKDCGSTIEEARQKGCVFDVLLVAWLHADCFDSELMESYLSEVEYPFWIDRSLMTPITLDEVRLGNHKTVFSNQEFHLAHCAYYLEQSVRGFRDSVIIDNVTLDNGHTEHCARTLRDQWLPEMGYSPLHMDWHSCGRRRTTQ